MRVLLRIAATSVLLLACCLGAITATFFLVGRTLPRADKQMGPGGGQVHSPTPLERFHAWESAAISSGFTDWGKTTNGTRVNDKLAEALPRTLMLGSAAWLLAWSGGLMLALAFIAYWPRLGSFFLRAGYPAFQALPPVALVLFIFISLLRLGIKSESSLFLAAVPTLAILLLPSATSLWMNGILRVNERVFVQAARARGLHPWRLWGVHIARHLLLSSGIPSAAATSLAFCLGGSLLIERIFGLGGGLGSEFVRAVLEGEAEFAATASAFFFTTFTAAMILARLVIVLLDPDHDAEVS